MRTSIRSRAAALVLPLALAGGPARGAGSKAGHGVYQYVVENAHGTLEETSQALEAALSSSGLRLLAKVGAGVPPGCRFKARVFAVCDPAYAERMIAANRKTAPFAIVDRINVFEDEAGVHVAVSNAVSINRTVLMDDDAHADLGRAHMDVLRDVVAGAVGGKLSDREFGERRARGYIGKTMGVMAGGPFIAKIEDEVVVDSGDWKSVAEKVRQGLMRPGSKWGLQLAYELDLPEQETVIFGSTGSPLESKSFSIVGHGADQARGSFECPGVAHAAAYPIEVVVTREGEAVKVRLVDSMYRMKLYFEDAGKWAFMKNMGMPGSIHDELAAQIKAGLAIP